MRFVLSILIWIGLASAQATQAPSNCIPLLSAETNSSVLHNSQSDIAIATKIKLRAAQLAAEPAVLSTGIKKLFNRDIMQVDIDSARIQITQMASAWINNQRNIINKTVDAKSRNPVIDEMRLQIQALKEKYNTEVSEQSKFLTEKITDEYSSGLRSEPDFKVLQDQLSVIADKFVAELTARYPIAAADQSKELVALIENKNFFKDAITKNKNGLQQIEIRQSQALGIYEPSVGSFVLRLNEKADKSLSKDQAFQTLYLHGSGTNRSNVASWAALFPMLAQNGTQPFAFDLPGSVGEAGIAMNSLRTSQEVGLYINFLAEYGRHNREASESLPVIVVGRSAGSTDGLMSALTNHLAANTSTSPDLYLLTSFSDPRSIEMQDKNIQEQVRRGEVKGILQDALEHFTVLANTFQAQLETLKKQNPELLANFGDDVVFAQGEADQDGQFNDGSGRTALSNLTEYRDTFAPYAHIYEFADPLKNYRARGLLTAFTYDSLEATHFLYSNRENITEKNRGDFPREIIEIDLPKLRDQSYEVFALKFAMMDYLIDFSPVTSVTQKHRLAAMRQKFTGSSEKFNYLNWYVQEKLSSKIAGGEKTTLQKIIEDSKINADRSSGVAGRVKRVYFFILNEAKRIQTLQKQNRPAA